MAHLSDNTVLLIIDVQKGFDDPQWGNRNNPDAEQNIATLLKVWRETGRPIVHMQHCSTSPTSPLRPGYIGNDFQDLVRPEPSEQIFQKQVNSCFIGTNLEAWLREHGYDTLVIVGLTTPHCVSTTTRMAGNLGFRVYLVSDCTAAFDTIGPDGKYYSAEIVHTVSLATIHEEFARVVDTATLLEMILPTSNKDVTAQTANNS